MPPKDRNNNGLIDIVLSYLKNPTFVLTFLIAVFCLIIVILWGAFEFPPGMRDFSGYVVYTHTSPAFTVVFWGLLLGYLLNEEPPPKLLLIYTVVGIILFMVVGILQLFHLDDFTGYKIFVNLGLHVIVLVLLIANLILFLMRFSEHKKAEERPYVVRMSRGGLPVYR